MTSLHQPAALTSACWRGPRTRARATANFLETKAADSLSGAGPPRQTDCCTVHFLKPFPNGAAGQITCINAKSQECSKVAIIVATLYNNVIPLIMAMQCKALTATNSTVLAIGSNALQALLSCLASDLIMKVSSVTFRVLDISQSLKPTQ